MERLTGQNDVTVQLVCTVGRSDLVLGGTVAVVRLGGSVRASPGGLVSSGVLGFGLAALG